MTADLSLQKGFHDTHIVITIYSLNVLTRVPLDMLTDWNAGKC
jgi:hypothetical protein